MTCTTILTEEKIEQVAQGIIDDYDLDHNNAEINVDDDGCQIVVEAPNNATVLVDIYLNNIDKRNEKQAQVTMLNTIADKIKNFDADDEFNELWSYEFGRHNNFRPSQFIEMLLDDEDYFIECSKKMYQRAKELEYEIWKLEEDEQERI